MLKKLLFVIILISFTVQSQTYIKGTLSPAQNYSWVVLYQLKGAKQVYIKNTTIENGEFSFEFPENASKGMYRLMYRQQNNGFIDFIYNNENVILKFDPENPFETVEFLSSEENIIYHNYLLESESKQHRLDSLQLSYFSLEEKAPKNITSNLYKNSCTSFIDFQTEYEQKTNEKLANHFVKSSKKYYSSSLIQTPQEYLNSIKQHFFDFINFEDKELINSTFLSEKVTEYVFYLNGSEDIEVQNVLYKNAVDEVLKKIENVNFQSEILSTLLNNFAQIENTILIDFVLENYYDKLPEELKNKALIKDIQERVKLAVGKLAPEITWQENGITKKLSELDIAKNYLVVFWSTGCSHCLHEIPLLYEFTKDKPIIHVVAFAMERGDVEFKKYEVKYAKWTNILGLGKWQNLIAKKYQITSTPTYFVLDKNKKIIAKPDFVEDVKAFFEH